MRRVKLIVLSALALAMLGLLGVFAPRLIHSDEVLVAEVLPLGRTGGLIALQITTDTGDLIWAIESAREVSPEGVRYGEVPVGFIQRFPALVGPRELERGERLLITAASRGDSYLQINSRSAGQDGFFHGITVGGAGCEQPGCADLFRLSPIATPSQQ